MKRRQESGNDFEHDPEHEDEFGFGAVPELELGIALGPAPGLEPGLGLELEPAIGQMPEPGLAVGPAVPVVQVSYYRG